MGPPGENNGTAFIHVASMPSESRFIEEALIIAFLFHVREVHSVSGACPIPKISPVGGRLKMKFSQKMNYNVHLLSAEIAKDKLSREGV